MPGRMEMDESDSVDLGKRSDIYVAETTSRIVVFRGAFFRGVKFLEKEGTFNFRAEFIEIEQANGEAVFVRRHSIIKFCDVGGKVSGELLTPEGNGPGVA